MTGSKTLGILGKKLGMTQIFREDGICIPVTVIEAGPCKVLQVKVATRAEHPEGHRTSSINRGKKGGRTEKVRDGDGYYAVQLGYDPRPARLSSKSELGHTKKVGLDTGMRVVSEFRLTEAPTQKPGDEVTVSILKDWKRCDVTGTSKGRGWAGTIKRHNFAGQNASHGNSLNHRRAGGIGRQYTTSHGVPKGKKMAGHYGAARITVQRLEIVKVDEERNLVYIRGAVPGYNSAYVTLHKTIKNERFPDAKK